MNHYKRFDFGDSANGFIRKQLGNGLSLSKYLLKECLLTKGSAHTYLPMDVVMRDARKFENGLWTKCKDAPVTPQILQGYNWAPRHARDVDIVLEIQQLLAAQSGRLFLVEDLITSGDSDAPKLKDYGTNLSNLFVHNKEVYFGLYSGDASVEKVERTLTLPHNFYLVGVVSEVPIELAAKKDTLTDQELQIIARNAIVVIVGAYDDEGYIIWEKEKTLQKRQ